MKTRLIFFRTNVFSVAEGMKDLASAIHSKGHIIAPDRVIIFQVNAVTMNNNVAIEPTLGKLRWKTNLIKNLESTNLPGHVPKIITSAIGSIFLVHKSMSSNMSLPAHKLLICDLRPPRPAQRLGFFLGLVWLLHHH